MHVLIHKSNCTCVPPLFQSPLLNKCFCFPCSCGICQVKCQLWPQNVLLKSCLSFLHKQVHEKNQQAVKVEITCVCPKSWHPALKRKKKAQMSFHQRTYLCGKKEGWGEAGSHRDTAHSWLLQLSTSTDLLCVRRNGDQTHKCPDRDQCWKYSAILCALCSPQTMKILTLFYTWSLWISFPGQVGKRFRISREGKETLLRHACGSLRTIPWAQHAALWPFHTDNLSRLPKMNI